MRKYLALVLGVLFVLGFAASAFAIHAEIPSETTATVAKGGTQITIGGEIRARGEFQHNTSDFNNDKTDDKAFYDQRVRLLVDAKVSPNVSGRIQLESVNNDPDSLSQDLYTWGNNKVLATGTYRAGNEKGTSLNILEAWILYNGSGLFGFNSGLKVGHTPLALGNGLFFDHTKYGDDAIVFFMDPMKELHIALLTAKFREGNTSFNDDANAYVGLVNWRTKEFGLSGDVTYVDDQLGTGANPAATQTAKTPVHFWNLALRGDTNLSGFVLKGDIEFQTGEIKVADKDFKGIGAMVGVGYDYQGVKLGLDVLYGSGPKQDSTNVDQFVTSLGADKHFTYVYEYRTVNACGAQYGGICNTTLFKLYAGADLAKDLSGNLDLAYILANKRNKVTIGGEQTTGDSKTVGFEIDAKVAYKLDRNLQYWVEGGYLFAGSFYNTPTHSSSDAYAVRQGIQLNF